MFVMVDGIDGSGKSTITKAWREMFEARSEKIFDAVAFAKAQRRIPTIEDVGDAHIIFSAEPTYAGLGKELRDHMLSPGSTATPREVTEKFAEARAELYEAMIIPALAAGKVIIQDRGLTSSLAYQPTMSEEITEEFVAGLPGNQLALQHRPDYVILCDVPADVAMSRLAGRTEKQDDSIFEKKEYMLRVAARFQTTSWQKYLTDAGTKIIVFNANQPIALAIRAAQRLLIDLVV